jgi:hypothetical protein
MSSDTLLQLPPPRTTVLCIIVDSITYYLLLLVTTRHTTATTILPLHLVIAANMSPINQSINHYFVFAINNTQYPKVFWFSNKMLIYNYDSKS